MNPLLRIVGWAKGKQCHKLISYTKNEISITGVKPEIGNFEIGGFSSKIVELVKASSLAINLDNTQYMLCEEIANLEEKDSLRKDCVRIRLQIILAFDQLQNILGTIKTAPSMNLRKELREWIKFTGDLHRIGIKTLQGEHPGKGAMKLAKVMKYQGFNELQMQEAIKNY